LISSIDTHAKVHVRCVYVCARTRARALAAWCEILTLYIYIYI